MTLILVKSFVLFTLQRLKSIKNKKLSIHTLLHVILCHEVLTYIILVGFVTFIFLRISILHKYCYIVNSTKIIHTFCILLKDSFELLLQLVVKNHLHVILHKQLFLIKIIFILYGRNMACHMHNEDIVIFEGLK